MKKISEDNWMDFSMDALAMVNKYVIKSQKRTASISSGDSALEDSRGVVTETPPPPPAITSTPTTSLVAPTPVMSPLTPVPGGSLSGYGSYLASFNNPNIHPSLFNPGPGWLSPRLGMMNSISPTIPRQDTSDN